MKNETSCLGGNRVSSSFVNLVTNQASHLTALQPNPKIYDYFVTQLVSRFFTNLWDTPIKPLLSCNDATLIFRIILNMARRDAFVATVMICFRGDRSDNVRSHRQKLYNNTFGSFPLVAYNKLIAVIVAYVKALLHEEHRTSFASP